MAWTIDRISMGTFALDGGAMFGIVPKPLWEKSLPADEKNRVPMATNCMLLQDGTKKVIVEVGCGWEFDEKEREFYKMSGNIRWTEALKPFNLTPTDITDVIVTHLHFDHASGLVQRDPKNNELTLCFPNATHYVQRKQLEWAKNPTERDRGSYRKDGTHAFFSGIAKAVLVEGDVEILPGIRAQVINGHSPGQQMIHVDTDRGHFVFVADLFPTTSHLHLPWIMAYDLFPLETLKERKLFLQSAAEQDWIFWYYHDTRTTAGKIVFDGKRYQAGDKIF